ncbi:MAG: hypothetical protein J0L73_25300 [Verrucomicrobia bacterium]|nr:hypothetical protein [Verrucomicrobiota bacterium]
MTLQPTTSGPKSWRRILVRTLGILLLLVLGIYLSRNFWIKTVRAYYLGRVTLASEELGRNLPAVDEVEILALGGEVAECTPDSFSPDLGPPVGTISRRSVRGAEAAQLASVWRGIDFDRHYAALCFSPYYALRFRHQGRLVLETAVCWHCSTYTLPAGVFGHVEYGFDSKGTEAQTLLAALTQLCPHPPTSK